MYRKLLLYVHTDKQSDRRTDRQTRPGPQCARCLPGPPNTHTHTHRVVYIFEYSYSHFDVLSRCRRGRTEEGSEIVWFFIIFVTNLVSCLQIEHIRHILPKHTTHTHCTLLQDIGHTNVGASIYYYYYWYIKSSFSTIFGCGAYSLRNLDIGFAG